MKNKLLITTALVALSVSGNAHADVTINSDTVLESEYTDNVIISGGNVTTKDSSTVSLNYPDGKNLTVNGGNLSLNDSTIYTFNGNTEISGDAVLNLNNDSDIDTNKLTISGGTINLNKGELRQNNSFTMTGGTINANGQTQIGSVGRDTEKVEGTVTSYAGGTTDISGGVINVKGGVGLGSSANDIYDNGNVIFGTSIKLRGDATLDIKEGATLFAYENYKIDEPDLDNSDLDVVTFGNKATITMNDNTSKINLAGTLSANINGDDRGKIHFQNSGAFTSGTGSGLGFSSTFGAGAGSAFLGVKLSSTGFSLRVAGFFSGPRTAFAGIFVVSEIFTFSKSTIIGGCSSKLRLLPKNGMSKTHSKTTAICKATDL